MPPRVSLRALSDASFRLMLADECFEPLLRNGPSRRARFPFLLSKAPSRWHCRWKLGTLSYPWLPQRNMYAGVTSSDSIGGRSEGTAPTCLISVTEGHVVADPGRALALDATIGPFVNASALRVLNRACNEH